jgi:hypothetical protein
MTTNTPAGFPLVEVPFVDRNGRLTRDWMYFLQALYARTGGSSGQGQPGPPGAAGAAGPPLYLDSAETDEPFIIQGPIGNQGPIGVTGAQGAIGPAVYLEAPEADEPIVIPPRLSPGGWYDEKGSGGTYGFAAGVDFTAGTSTTLTLSQPYGSQANLIVAFDAAWQGADQFSLSGKTLTFTSAIPTGTVKVFVKGYLVPG